MQGLAQLVFRNYRKSSIKPPPPGGGGGLFISSMQKWELYRDGGLIERGGGLLNLAKLTR